MLDGGERGVGHVDKRYGAGGSLSRAGLGETHEVAPFEHGGDGLLLDGCHVDESHLVEGLLYFRSEVELCELHELPALTIVRRFFTPNRMTRAKCEDAARSADGRREALSPGGIPKGMYHSRFRNSTGQSYAGWRYWGAHPLSYPSVVGTPPGGAVGPETSQIDWVRFTECQTRFASAPRPPLPERPMWGPPTSHCSISPTPEQRTEPS